MSVEIASQEKRTADLNDGGGRVLKLLAFARVGNITIAIAIAIAGRLPLPCFVSLPCDAAGAGAAPGYLWLLERCIAEVLCGKRGQRRGACRRFGWFRIVRGGVELRRCFCCVYLVGAVSSHVRTRCAEEE